MNPSTLTDDQLRVHLELERKRGQSGHWAYDINRHLALAAELGKREKKERKAAA